MEYIESYQDINLFKIELVQNDEDDLDSKKKKFLSRKEILEQQILKC